MLKKFSRASRLIAVGLLPFAAFFVAHPAMAQPSEAIVETNSSFRLEGNPRDALGVQYAYLNTDVTLEQANRRTPQSVLGLIRYLSDIKNYTFEADPVVPDNPPFRPTGLTEAVLSPGVQFPTSVGGVPSTLKYQIRMQGYLHSKASGVVKLRVPTDTAITSDWVLKDSEDNTGESLTMQYNIGQDWELKRFHGKAAFGFDGKNPTLDFNGDGYLNGEGSAIRSLSVRSKIPLRKPKDVRNTPGADRDASREVPDSVELAYNQIRYRRGGHLGRLGLRARTTGSLNGLEAVAYYAPSRLMGWYDGARGFYGLEAEVGYRQGDAEFTSLTTRAPDTGSLVARLGGVVEWAPEIGGINRQLGKGLRFFVRGRGWLDTYKNGSGDTSLRLRPFADTELFYNFTEERRIFVRGEYGYLPPDLSGKATRVYGGVGAAF